MDYLHESAASIYRRRRRQRTLITMTCVIGLCVGTAVYAASYVQGWVGIGTPSFVSAVNASCNGATSRPLTPSAVTVNVYNATSHTGLAADVAASLAGQHFNVATVDNDPLERTILGVGEIRHGQSGLAAAILAAQRLPGARLVQDARMDASVDIVLGNGFRTLRSPPRSAPSKTAKPVAHC